MILSDDQKQIQELAAKAARDLLAPVVAEDDEAHRFRPELIRALGERGLTGIATPSSWGGAGLGYLEYALVIEEIAAVSAAYAISVAVSGLPQVILNEFGSEELQRLAIPALAQGTAIGAFALSESGAGSDPGSLQTRAEKQGEHYVLNGTKLWCTQGNLAQYLIVFARTGPSGSGTRGLSAFLIEKGTPGFKTGKIEDKMGLNISPTCELILENVKVPAKSRIGEEGQGFAIAMRALDSGRITIGATAVGLSRSALDYSLRYSRMRQQFQQAIGDFQGLQFLFADSYVALSGSRHLVHHAAALKDAGQPYSLEAAAAKLAATDAAMSITTDAVQVLGGAGYTKEYPVERMMREAKVLQIVEGTNQVQRVVIARALAKSVS